MPPTASEIDHANELSLARSSAMLRAGPADIDEGVSELLYNEPVDLIRNQGEWAEVVARLDGYRGWMRRDALRQRQGMHRRGARLRCQALASFGYERADLLAPSLWVSFGTPIEVREETTVRAPRTGEEVRLLRDAGGLWFPAPHFGTVTELDAFVGHAKKFLGTPYLWGGRTSRGLDCSALVQLALNACGRPCPRDTSEQVAEVGDLVDIASIEKLCQGDLLFWPGHVAIYLDKGKAVHADGVSMTVRVEGIEDVAANRHSSLDKMIVRRPS